MKLTLPIASHPAAFVSTLPPISEYVMTIPIDISTFMTVLLFPGLVHEAHYTFLRRNVAKSPREFTIYADDLWVANSQSGRNRYLNHRARFPSADQLRQCSGRPLINISFSGNRKSGAQVR